MKKNILELRKQRTRRKIFGTPERPRLTVRRSLKHITAQVINDVEGKTLVYVTTMSADFGTGPRGNVASSEKVGTAVAKAAQAAGIQKVVFDRGGIPYHGCIKAVAEAARKGGLEF